MKSFKRILSPASPYELAVEARVEHQRQLVLAEQRLRHEQRTVRYHQDVIERLGDLADQFKGK